MTIVCAVALLALLSAAPPASTPYLWKNVEIVGGGFVSGIVFHPKQKDLIYARTDIGGAYRWNPATRRWVPLQDFLSSADWNLYGVESLGIDPTDPKRLYLAAGTYTNDWAGNGAILRSVDQGRSWKRFDLPFKNGGNEDGRSIGERLAVDPEHPNVVLFGTRHNGLWRSDDFGATWKADPRFPVTGPTNGIGIGFVLFHDRKVLVGVARPNANLYESHDDGARWTMLPGQPAGSLPHHGAYGADGALYVTYSNGPGPNGVSDGAVWKRDAAGRWTDITPVRPGSAGVGSFGYAGLSVDARRPGTLIVSSLDKWSSGDTIWRSTDGGASWTDLKPKSVRDSSGAPFLMWDRADADFGHWIGDIEIDPFDSGRALYVTGATIWGTDDLTAADRAAPTHWTVRAQGLEETAVLDLASPPSGAPLISALGDIGGFRHDDLVVSPRAGIWKDPVLSNTDSLDVAAHAPQIVVRVGRGQPGKNGAVSMDGALTWTAFATQPIGVRGGGSVALSADGTTVLWAPQGAGVHVSQDRGATWTPSADVPAGAVVAADRVDARRFFAYAPRTGTLLVSEDSGARFTALPGTVPPGDAVLKTPLGAPDNVWLAAGDRGLWHRSASGPLARIDGVDSARAIGFGKSKPGVRYPALYLNGTVTGVSGVFRSDDVGKTWVRIDDDAHRFGTRNVLTGDPRVYGRVYLGTNGRGILVGEPRR
jgi:hypothetical protein